MPNRLYRDLVTLQRMLEDSGNWRLSPDQWHRTGEAVGDLARHLATLDQRGIDAVLRQLEEIDPGSRAVNRIDGP
ncbi:MAG TPA: CATRA system-associated protein, partial [Micromonospora sp.]